MHRVLVFAGQVYRVKVLEIERGPIEGLETDAVYAMKILIPPSYFYRLFRNALYWLGLDNIEQSKHHKAEQCNNPDLTSRKSWYD